MATGFLNRFRRSLALTPTLSRRERGPFKIGFKPCSLHRDQTLSPWVAPDWGQPNHTVRPQNTPAEPQAIAPINGSLYPICRPIGLCHRGPEGLPQLLCARCSTFSAAISTGKTGESHSAYSPSLLVYRQPAQIANTQRGFPNNRPNIPRLSSMGHQTRRDSLMRDFASSSALNARKSSHEGRFVQGMRTPLRLSIMMQGR